MGTVGTLNATRSGGWTGLVFIMAHRVRITLAPNDHHARANAPKYRAYAGSVELGAFWERQTRESKPRDYLSGELDFPGLSEPISLGVFFSDDGQSAHVAWKRKSKNDDARRQEVTGNDGLSGLANGTQSEDAGH